MSLFIYSTVYFCLLKKSIMPRVCLFNYFFKTTGFLFCRSDDQPFILDTTTRVAFQKLKSTFQNPSVAHHTPF